MSLQQNKKILIELLSNNYFGIMIVGYLFALFSGGFSVVVLSSLLLIALFMLNISKLVKVDFIVVYLFYLIISIVGYIGNRRPISIYITAIAYMVLPMAMYFVPKYRANIIMKKSMNAIFFSLIVALIMYLWAPQFYAEYLYNRNLIGRSDVRWIRPSLIQGLYGITTVASFGTCCALYHFFEILNKSKYSVFKFIFCVAIVLYAQRRSAIATLILGLLIANIMLCRKGRISTRQVTLNLILVAGVLVGIIIFKEQIFSLMHSVLSVGSAVSERNGNWRANLSSISSGIIFGWGLGSYGHIAGSMGFSGVFDSQYILMIMENGIVGVMIFCLVIGQAFNNFLKSKNKEILPMLIVVVFLIQCVGSNVLEMPMPAALFWFSLSFMQRNTSHKKTKHIKDDMVLKTFQGDFGGYKI